MENNRKSRSAELVVPIGHHEREERNRKRRDGGCLIGERVYTAVPGSVDKMGFCVVLLLANTWNDTLHKYAAQLIPNAVQPKPMSFNSCK